MYVYRITNVVTKESYIGLTSDFGKRISQHIRESRLNRSCNRKLYKSMAEYGIENFCWWVIEETEDESREKYWIDEYDSWNNGLNGTIDGKGNRFTYSNGIKSIGSCGERCVKITDEMIELAKEQYQKNGGFRLASIVSKIPHRKIKYILQQNGVTKKMIKKALKITESNKYDGRPFYIIDNKTGKIIKEYECVKSFLKGRHFSLKQVLSRLNGNGDPNEKVSYKWR